MWGGIYKIFKKLQRNTNEIKCEIRKEDGGYTTNEEDAEPFRKYFLKDDEEEDSAVQTTIRMKSRARANAEKKKTKSQWRNFITSSDTSK